MSEPTNDYPVKRPWTSLITVLGVLTQNAFNDNFLKLIFISLAGIVASQQAVGKYAEQILAAFIPGAFLIFSPLAGFCSDRFSKRSILFWAVIAQLFILGMAIASIQLKSIYLGLGCFLLLSVQSTFFSPAKSGILKELVGSKRLTIANGMMQMLTMVAILGGVGLSGTWFGIRQGQALDQYVASQPGFEQSVTIPEGATDKERRSLIHEAIPDEIKNPQAWKSASLPIFAVSIGAFLPLFMNFLVDRTPDHSKTTRFSPVVLFRHFSYLKALFSDQRLMRCNWGIAYYWFVASFYGVVMIQFGKELHPTVATGEAAKVSSLIGVTIGAGLMLGSILVAIICRKGNKIELAPFGGIGMTLAIIGTAVLAPGLIPFYVAMAMIGFCGAFFIVPLSTFLQDFAESQSRGRILAASAITTSVAGLLSIGISLGLTKIGVKPSQQLLFFIIPTALATWYVYRFTKLYRTNHQSVS